MRRQLLPPFARPVLTLRTGETIAWPAAPDGFAQVIELRRTNVRILYRCRTGRLRQPIISPAAIARLLHEQREPVLPLFNPFGRAAMGKASKDYETSGQAN